MGGEELTLPEASDDLPLIELRDAIKLGVFILGTAVGLGIAHYIERKQGPLPEEA